MPIADRLALLRRMKKNWLELNFQKQGSRIIETSTSAYTLQSSVLMIGTSTSGSLVEAISGHLLNSPLVGTNSFHWNIDCSPGRVRDITIDPYQDLLVLIEESVTE